MVSTFITFHINTNIELDFFLSMGKLNSWFWTLEMRFISNLLRFLGLYLIYLVQRVCIGFVADVQVMFNLSHGPHACPVVLLPDGQQQWSDGIVELRNRHWKPGAQEHDVCTKRQRKAHTVHHEQFKSSSSLQVCGSSASAPRIPPPPRPLPPPGN